MIDADYFRGPLNHQRLRVEQQSTVKLHLQDGACLILFSVEAIEEGYVLVQAYPEQPSPGVWKRRSDMPALQNGPRHAIPYASIARVEVTAESQKERSLGFPLQLPQVMPNMATQPDAPSTCR